MNKLNKLYNISIVFKSNLNNFYSHSTKLNCPVLLSVINHQIYQFSEISRIIYQLSDNTSFSQEVQPARLDYLHTCFNEIIKLMSDFYIFVNNLLIKRSQIKEFYVNKLDTATYKYEKACNKLDNEMDLIIDYGKQITILNNVTFYDALKFLNVILQNDINTGIASSSVYQSYIL